MHIAQRELAALPAKDLDGPASRSDPGATPRPSAPTAFGRFSEGLENTFACLTWSRFGAFCLIVGIIGLSQPAAFYALFAGKTLPGLPARPLIPGMPVGAEGLAKAIATQFLQFLPVLLAVVAIESRRIRDERKRVVALGVAVVAGQAVGTALWAVAHTVLYADGFFPRMAARMADSAGMLRYFGGYGLRNLAYSGAAVAFYYFVRRSADAAQGLHRAQLGRERAEREDAEARIQMIQAQIEPHFLFNTLASVRRLYQTDPGAGREMLRQLSRYLTASLPRMRQSRSTLGHEIALADAYLNVQKIRMGSRLAFGFDVPADLAEVEIPPMMIATLVENAVIHGIGPLPGGGRIDIRARAAATAIVVEVSDNGRGLRGIWGVGVGLSNIHSRLASAYDGRASLALRERDEGGVVATIRIPVGGGDPRSA